MDSLFKAIPVEKVSDKIINQFISLITEGALLPGEKLPSERRLAEVFGVGRSSLREALSTLETLGFVELRKRRGNYVKSVDSGVPLSPLQKIMQVEQRRIVELYELRRSIEQSAAREAAERRTAADMATIEQALARVDQPTGVLHFAWDDEQAFHLAVARASHNFLRLHTLKSIFDFSRKFIEPVLQGFLSSEPRMTTVSNQHRAICQAIDDSDPSRARQCMKEHLQHTIGQLSAYFNEPQ